MKSKIILIATGIFPPDIGGPAAYSKTIADSLVDSGFKVRVLTFGARNYREEKKYLVVGVSRRLPKGLRHLVYLAKLWRLARDADLIFAQNATSVGLPALIAAGLLKKRLVLKIVIDAAVEVARLPVRRFRPKTVLDEPDFKSYGARPGSRFRQGLQKFTAKRADGIIVPCRYLEAVVAGWGVPERKIRMVYNGVENFDDPGLTREEARGKIGVSGDVILSVGRLVAGKGFRMLIKIMPRLLEVNPRFRLLIAGDGYELPILNKMVENLKLKHKVTLLGKKTPEEIKVYFRTADFFVLNSFSEGLAHVILEAMAASLPVITTNVGGSPEIITDGLDGLLVNYNDENALVETIRIVYQNQQLRENLSRNAVKKSKIFSVDKMIQNTLVALTSF